ncbi:MAG: NAD(P)/FAD-dependent oxidoreductase [Pseudomonadota bacterium]
MTEPLDLVIIGAGLSGIGAACRYVTEFPDSRYTILEARDAIGGTWDLFRYPGIRSDSDMLTLGYDFRPWPGAKTLAEGPAIRNYVRETAREYGVDAHIQFDSRVVAMDFSSQDDLWTLTVETDGKTRSIEARFVLSCAGYYRYDKGHDPDFKGRDDFQGDIIHPQFWPEEFDYAGKRIAVIGSGATAVTLVPELAKTAAHVVQVQRTPSYVASIPSEDPVVKLTSKIMPKRMSFALNRWKNRKLAGSVYRRAKAKPAKVRANIRKRTLKALGRDYPVDIHFNPPYDPWDQRLCLTKDDEYFDAIRKGRASVVTARIDRFTPDGLRMSDGSPYEFDVIVTATGLEANFGSNFAVSVDGELQDYSTKFTYRGVMTTDVPNLVDVLGYTNASWTLRADLTSRWFVRVRKHMKAHGFTRVVADPPKDGVRNPATDFQAGYIARVLDRLPSQGERLPWRNVQNYKHDCDTLIKGPLQDDALRFSGPEDRSESRSITAEAAE